MEERRTIPASSAAYAPGHAEPWGLPPAEPSLGVDEVHVWRSRLGPGAEGRVRRFLSEDERARARRFRFAEDRQRFTCARGVLRVVLAYYTGADPARVRLCYGQHGKPALDPTFGADWLRFNLSHSRDLALIVVARGREAGVDIEYVSPHAADDSLAARFFSDGEAGAIRSAPGGERAAAFFSYWTLKEAYLKARGEGLSAGLDEFEVSMKSGGRAAIVGHVGEPEEVSRWSLRTLSPAPGYRAALAVEGDGWKLSRRRVTEELLCKWSPRGGAGQGEPARVTSGG